jgi:hypothetical protein
LGAVHSRSDLAIPVLSNALKDTDWLVRSYSSQALGRFGPEANKAISSLSDALKDQNGHVKVKAALALWKIEGKNEQAISVLIKTLNGEGSGSYSAQAAADALGDIGPPAKAGVPHLIVALNCNCRGLRVAAAGALWKITSQAEPAVMVLSKALKDLEFVEDSDTATALTILQDMGPQAMTAVPALLALQEMAHPLFRESVAKTLRRIDPEAVIRAGPL